MDMGKSERSSLTPAAWSEAAIRAIARGGVNAVAIEPIAAELGATKGSFYWHFKNRDALIEAALDEWERRLTDDVIQKLEREPDPAQRLKKLLAGALELRPIERSAEIALLAHPEHPVVLRRVRKVTQRRIEYMALQLERLGWEQVEAVDRAVVLSYLYSGHLQMTHLAPNIVSRDARRRHVELIFDSLIAGNERPGDSFWRSRDRSDRRERPVKAK
jgi:AcrR family transcriptional regulator